MVEIIKELVLDEEGATAVEYGLIVGAIARSDRDGHRRAGRPGSATPATKSQTRLLAARVTPSRP